MDELVLRQDELEERTVTPAEVWNQLSPEIQARVVGLLAEMAYKYVLTQGGLLHEGAGHDVNTEVRDEVHCCKNQDN